MDIRKFFISGKKRPNEQIVAVAASSSTVSNSRNIEHGSEVSPLSPTQPKQRNVSQVVSVSDLATQGKEMKQIILSSYPKQGTNNRSFQVSWFQRFVWLVGLLVVNSKTGKMRQIPKTVFQVTKTVKHISKLYKCGQNKKYDFKRNFSFNTG